MTAHRLRGARLHAVEWPTASLLVACYLAFGALTYFGDALPLWLLIPAGACVVCLYGSLQHEVIHGHPTRHAILNEALVFPSLSLWVPFRRYRRTHLMHHNDDYLTDPIDDPESWYLEPATWAALPAAVKNVLKINNSLAGRLTIGPLVALSLFVWHEIRRGFANDRGILGAWVLHAGSVSVTLFWVMGVCGMSFWTYVLIFAYPGTSLSLLRSFAEHRADHHAKARSAVIETNPILGLLFLNNNLHAAHHDNPRLAWYQLPAFYQSSRERLLEQNGRYHMVGYLRLAQRFLFTPKESVPHPLKGG
ncbi:fatty acid desaturase [Rhodoligotrophos appendicifer]|uniref:fatty acid desaturase n=1 Tax=Rhodoligotrophos appendicifer TaxID=987056 RepID=UPI0011854D76|nr:fatty acid desaturase [Rhodoligotrophos appendicifer]